MRSLRLVLTAAAAFAASLAAVGGMPALAAAAPAAQRVWVWPLSPRPEVVRPFEPPGSPWGPGHRGVDLAGAVGQRVLAIGAGTITFASVLAGRGVVVVRHGALRSTYEPVTALVHRGQQVTAGQPIALLQTVGSHCLPRTCLHLGVRRGEEYLDPLTLLPRGPVRLKPLDGLSTQGGSGSLSGSPPRGGAAGPVGRRPDGQHISARAGAGGSGPAIGRQRRVGPGAPRGTGWRAGTTAVVAGAGLGLAGAALRRRQARG